MSETQLERSVLEAKERDELVAIADALGAKPGARAKKADLVSQILRATGVEPPASDTASDAAEKPKRTRARKATAATAAAPPIPVPTPPPVLAEEAAGNRPSAAAAAAPRPTRAQAAEAATEAPVAAPTPTRVTH